MPERHPVQERPDLPLERRAQLLEQHLARLWDEVWWMRLPPWRRLLYRLRGFREPIPMRQLDSAFYEDG